MKKPPLVSILMPCFNAAAYVGPAIESVLSQTYPHIELVVVDDGSSDGSGDVIKRYVEHGVRLFSQPNAGQCAAANAAFRQCSGELIKFFDADDLLGADAIERQVSTLAGRSDVIAFGEWDRFFGGVPEAAAFPPRNMYRDADPVDWLASEWKGARPMMQCGLWLIPRPILERSGLWDERLSLINDFEFFARVLLKASYVAFSPGSRLYYRSGIGGSLSSLRSRRAVESALLSMTLGTNHLLSVEASPRTKMACADIFADFNYTYFPRFRDLRREARKHCMKLGGSILEPDGPPRFHQLRRVVGWRVARIIELSARAIIPSESP